MTDNNLPDAYGQGTNSALSHEKPHIVLCGACLSGNIGGPALYISFVEEFQKYFPEARVSVLSKYPATDTPVCERLGWTAYDLRTLKQLLVGVPLALAAGLLRLFRLPGNALFRGAFSPYAKGDLLVDLSGISFSDHRPGMGLVINALWFVPALASGIPIVKLSQAMGPFSKPSTRIVSRFFLSRMRRLVARGELSKKYCEGLLPDREIPCLPDMAFALRPAEEARLAELKREHGIPDLPYAALGPSHVVETFATESHTCDYVTCMAEAARWLLENTSLRLVLLPHEVKNSSEDDSSVCRAIFEALPEPLRQRVHLMPLIEDPRLAKALCAGAEVAIGSRFHFLVATLSSCVPSLAVSWSHKYNEMMRMTGQEDMILSYNAAGVDAVRDMTERLWNEREERARTLRDLVPGVIEDARKNACLARDALLASESPAPAAARGRNGNIRDLAGRIYGAVRKLCGKGSAVKGRERGVLDFCRTEENEILFKAAQLRISYERGHLLKEFVRCSERVPGDVAEMGVYKGNSAYVIADVMTAWESGKKLYLFDTFQGTPAAGSQRDNHARGGQYADTSVSGVMDLLEPFKDDVIPVAGMIPDSFRDVAAAVWSFVHIHLNLYQSTKDALEYAFPRLSPGGVIFIEDYGLRSCSGVKCAVDEFCLRKGGIVMALPSGQGVIIKNEYQ